MNRFLKVAALSCAAWLHVPAFSAAPAEAVPLGPLPDVVTPLAYTLDLELDPAASSFEGEARIRVRLKQPSDALWLHGKSLRVSQVDVLDAQGTSTVAAYEQLHEDGVSRVRLPRVFPPQELTLRFRYEADYGANLSGLFKVVEEVPYLVTHMEPVGARLAFPCFDEPGFKTPFDITLTVPAPLVAVSNAAQRSERRDGGWKTVQFERTAPLPTYLVAFAVGPWDVVEMPAIPPNDVRSVPVALRGLAAHGQGARLRPALEQASEMFATLERYFGLPYPFGKLDVLAAPDAAWGGMENVGLIILQSRYALLDEHSSVGLRQAIFNVLAHEIAHQWFGDLVTMRWWNDIWLNESFATWIATKVTQQLRPSYRDDLQQQAATIWTFTSDSLASARRIRQEARTNDDLAGAFDEITYSKGAALLSMLESWMGPEAFREGIRLYLRQHALGSATSDDVVAALAGASDDAHAVKRVAASFIDQGGLPLVSTSLECGPDGNRIRLRQGRYVPVGSSASGDTRWSLPVCVRTMSEGRSERTCTLLEKPAQTMVLSRCPEWYLPNAGATGYYRFVMPPAELAKLRAAVGDLLPVEQMIFADAIDAGFKRGDIDAAQALDAMGVLSDSPLPSVATALTPTFDWIYRHLAQGAERAAMTDYAGALWQARLGELGWTARDGEGPDATLLRQTLTEFLVDSARVPAVRAQLLRHVEDRLGDAVPLAIDKIDPDLAANALSVWMQERGAPAVRRAMEELARNRDPQQRRVVRWALGTVTDPALAPGILDFGLSDAIRVSEMSGLYSAHASQIDVDRTAYADWVAHHFDRLLARWPADRRASLVSVADTGPCTAAAAEQLERFFAPRLPRLEGGRQILAETTEDIRLCAALKERQGTASLAAWADARRAGE